MLLFTKRWRVVSCEFLNNRKIYFYSFNRNMVVSRWCPSLNLRMWCFKIQRFYFILYSLNCFTQIYQNWHEKSSYIKCIIILLNLYIMVIKYYKPVNLSANIYESVSLFLSYRYIYIFVCLSMYNCICIWIYMYV